MKTIQIAGAGPSGLAAAIVLAKAGHPVEIFEARKHVGARFIGDFQVIDNISAVQDAQEMLAHYGLSVNFLFKPIREATFFDHRLKPQAIKSEKPFGYFVQRGIGANTLDAGLLAQATAAGVKVSYERRIKAADIIATGPTSPDGLAKQATFSTSLPDIVWVLFDMTCSPGGYSYLFVIDGEATFGCAITRDFQKINEYFDLSLRRFQQIAPFTIQREKTGYSFMSFQIKESAMHASSCFVGEAGGFQDYLFGLGLRYALTTGYWAAQSITRNEAYDPLWKKALGASQEISLVNRFLYEWGGNLGLSTFIKRAAREDARQYLHRWHLPHWGKQLLLPVIKWQWRAKRRCVHPLVSHWCRHKEALPRISSIEALSS